MVSRRDHQRMNRANVRSYWGGEMVILTMVMIMVLSAEVWNGLGEARSTLCGLGQPQQ